MHGLLRYLADWMRGLVGARRLDAWT
jgi:hypothetical protein